MPHLSHNSLDNGIGQWFLSLMKHDVHPVTQIACETIKLVQGDDVERLEEILTEGILDDENADICSSCLETWTAIKQGDKVSERDAMGLAIIIQQIVMEGAQDDDEEQDGDDDGPSDFIFKPNWN